MCSECTSVRRQPLVVLIAETQGAQNCRLPPCVIAPVRGQKLLLPSPHPSPVFDLLPLLPLKFCRRDRRPRTNAIHLPPSPLPFTLMIIDIDIEQRILTSQRTSTTYHRQSWSASWRGCRRATMVTSCPSFSIPASSPWGPRL